MIALEEILVRELSWSVNNHCDDLAGAVGFLLDGRSGTRMLPAGGRAGQQVGRRAGYLKRLSLLRQAIRLMLHDFPGSIACGANVVRYTSADRLRLEMELISDLVHKILRT